MIMISSNFHLLLLRLCQRLDMVDESDCGVCLNTSSFY